MCLDAGPMLPSQRALSWLSLSLGTFQFLGVRRPEEQLGKAEGASGLAEDQESLPRRGGRWAERYELLLVRRGGISEEAVG